MAQKKEALRKVRSDKKREVQPTISVSLKMEIERLGYILDIPVKDVGQGLCYEGVHDEAVLDYLSPHFRGNVRSGKTIYFGNPEEEPPRAPLTFKKKARISIRFPQEEYGDIKLLATTFDVTPSRAVAILLDASIRNVYIIETMLQMYNERMSLDDGVKRELKALMRYVNKDNPYSRSKWNVTLLELIEGVKEVVKGRTKRITPEMVDAETYQWSFDEPVVEPVKKRRRKAKV